MSVERDDLEECGEEVPLTNWTKKEQEGEVLIEGLTFPSARSGKEVGVVIPLPSALGPESLYLKYYRRSGGSLPQEEPEE